MVNLIKFCDAIIFHRVIDLCSCTGRTFLISLQGGLSLAYEAYHTRILFFERYVRTLTYSILAYAYPRALSHCVAVSVYLFHANMQGRGFRTAAPRRGGKLQITAWGRPIHSTYQRICEREGRRRDVYYYRRKFSLSIMHEPSLGSPGVR